MANPYETGLDKNPANYQPLTPLVFLERAAPVHPNHTAIIHGSDAHLLRRVLRAHPQARLRARRPRHRRRRHRLGDARQYARHARGALRRAHDGRRAAFHQHPPRRRVPIAFMLDHADTKVLIGDTEFGPVLKQALKQAKVKPLLIDYRDLQCGVEGTRLGNLDYEDFIADGDPDYLWSMPSRRMERHLAQLHQRHDRQPQGRRVPPSRRGADVLRQHARDRHGPAPDLSLDAADVPLQRLVLPLVDQPRLRHACLPPLGPRQADVRRDRQSRGDASLGCALRHVGRCSTRPRRRGAPSASASPSTTPQRRRPPPCSPRWTRPGSSSPIFTG